MDIQSIELGMLFLIIFTAPVAYAVTNKSRRKKASLKKIREKAATHQINLNEIDLFSTVFIGIDEQQAQLVYGNLETLDSKLHILNFKNYNVELLEKRKKDRAIEQIALIFKSQKDTHQLDLYLEEEDTETSAIQQLDFAKKWQAKLS
ncbi:hypothetical protein ACFQ3R_11590 [Mesonia ostreae]|uniref:Uncharacterized protein n=1 Tax=Mesonia ostreae TaxID=861110 RepID=A0ABU2KIA6_9FLAO|nr:hypothetical protein [Mesonia ostreae]MDT0294409.1 hypothetical protein [Mesonia ostreae]